MTKEKLLKARTLIVAAIATVILSVVRTFAVLYGIEHKTGMFNPEGDIYNVVFYVLLLLTLAVLAVLAVFDTKDCKKGCKTRLTTANMTVMGVAMVVAGVIEMLSVLSILSGEINLLSLLIAVGGIALVIGGVVLASAKEENYLHSLPVAFIAVSYIAQAVKFYVETALISKSPQMLMTEIFFVTAGFFWVYFGRTLAQDTRRGTRILTVTSGYFVSASAVAFVISSYLPMAIDSEKWLQLRSIPSLTLVPAMLAPAVIATVLLFAKTEEIPENAAEEKEADEQADNQ